MTWIATGIIFVSLLTFVGATTPRSAILSILGLFMGWTLMFTTVNYNQDARIEELRSRLLKLENSPNTQFEQKGENHAELSR